MDPFTALYHSLEQMPGDDLALMALADCYLEEGQPDAAACARWSLARGRHPFRYTHGSLSITSDAVSHGHWWWTNGENHPVAAGWGCPDTCKLPRDMWKQLPHNHDYPPGVFKQYQTLREAYEALIFAWPLSPAKDRANVLRRWFW
ncbi:MAG: tetratricopeptide repeat protein [Gemmataceae bacterium]